MKQAKLLHNPGAGTEDHKCEELVSLIEANGFRCSYSSTKQDDWKDIDEEVDLLVVAGGDGTVRKLTKELLKPKKGDKARPIALLPMGTANNIAKTLELNASTEELIRSWHQWNIKEYDVGIIRDLEEASFFLESIGFGLFPYLIRQVRKRNLEDRAATPQEELMASLKLLGELAHEYEAPECSLEIDGEDYSGTYLLLEIMNIRSIGPNLLLAPDAQPDDGELEVVMIPEQNKEQFAAYISGQLKGEGDRYRFPSVRGRNIKVSWGGNHIHVDDEVFKIERNAKLKITLQERLLQFLVP